MLAAVLCVGSPPAQAEAASPSALAQTSLLTDAAQANGLMVAVGERGHILYSRDQGASWQQGRVPSRVLLTGVHLHNASLGWAVGHDATILRTQDGGISWQQVYSNTEHSAPLLDIWFADENYGLAVGGYGLLLETHDGGDSWQQRRLNAEDDYHLNQIRHLGGRQLLIAAEAGLLYRSNDLGTRWQRQETSYHGSWFGSLRLQPGLWLLYGLRGHVFSSHNQGEAWQPLPTSAQAMLTSGLRLQGGDCVLAGLNGELVLDRGCDAQQLIFYRLSSRQHVNALLENAHGQLLLFGSNGVTHFELEAGDLD